MLTFTHATRDATAYEGECSNSCMLSAHMNPQLTVPNAYTLSAHMNPQLTVPNAYTLSAHKNPQLTVPSLRCRTIALRIERKGVCDTRTSRRGRAAAATDRCRTARRLVSQLHHDQGACAPPVSSRGPRSSDRCTLPLPTLLCTGESCSPLSSSLLIDTTAGVEGDDWCCCCQVHSLPLR
jgi:hypothetical protein